MYLALWRTSLYTAQSIDSIARKTEIYWFKAAAAARQQQQKGNHSHSSDSRAQLFSYCIHVVEKSKQKTREKNMFGSYTEKHTTQWYMQTEQRANNSIDLRWMWFFFLRSITNGNDFGFEARVCECLCRLDFFYTLCVIEYVHVLPNKVCDSWLI